MFIHIWRHGKGWRWEITLSEDGLRPCEAPLKTYSSTRAWTFVRMLLGQGKIVHPGSQPAYAEMVAEATPVSEGGLMKKVRMICRMDSPAADLAGLEKWLGVLLDVSFERSTIQERMGYGYITCPDPQWPTIAQACGRFGFWCSELEEVDG